MPEFVAFSGHSNRKALQEALQAVLVRFQGATLVHGRAKGFDAQMGVRVSDTTMALEAANEPREVLWVEALLHAWGRWSRSGWADGLGYPGCPIGRLIRRGGARGSVVGGQVLELDEMDELGLAMENALRRLPRDQREALRKYYAARLTWEQVAQELQVDCRTVRRWRASAMEALAPVLMGFSGR